MNVFEFITQLRLRHVYTSKQTPVIDRIIIYINNNIVYKYVIMINPKMMKKAKRLGFTSNYKIFDEDIEPTKLETYYPQTNDGRYIIMIDPNTMIINVYNGEVTEEEQFKNLRRNAKISM